MFTSPPNLGSTVVSHRSHDLGRDRGTDVRDAQLAIGGVVPVSMGGRRDAAINGNLKTSDRLQRDRNGEYASVPGGGSGLGRGGGRVREGAHLTSDADQLGTATRDPPRRAPGGAI